jgi:DnaJ-class molecular chaperone
MDDSGLYIQEGVDMMDYKNYCKVLDIDRHAYQKYIPRVYRRMAKDHHPEHNFNTAQVKERFKHIHEAYQVLSDSLYGSRLDKFASEFSLGVFPHFSGKTTQAFQMVRGRLPGEQATKHLLELDLIIPVL